MSADIDRGSNPRSRGSRCGAWKRRLRSGDTLARRPGCRKKGRRGKTQYDPGRSRGNGVYSPRERRCLRLPSRVGPSRSPAARWFSLRRGKESNEGPDGRSSRIRKRKYARTRSRACLCASRESSSRTRHHPPGRADSLYFPRCDGFYAIPPVRLTAVLRVSRRSSTAQSCVIRFGFGLLCRSDTSAARNSWREASHEKLHGFIMKYSM